MHKQFTKRNRAPAVHHAALVVLLLLVSGRSADAAIRASFSGDSTLHAFSGRTGTADVQSSIGAEEKDVIRASFHVLALKTGHDGRDRKMYEMLDGSHFPTLSGTVLREDLLSGQPGDSIPLRLTIRETTRELPARKSLRTLEDGSSAMVLDFDVSLKEFGLKAPSVVGLIRVKDAVHVTVEVTMEPGGQP